jgi:60 kDa SS-A/Ro ribonucleoprotein
MPDPYAAIQTRSTPQSEQADPRQVPNAGGGYAFAIADVDSLRRFLILGTAGGTFYVGERELTRKNADVVIRMAETDPRLLINTIVEVSQAGRAPKQNPALFALAIAASLPTDPVDRQYALDALPGVARTASAFFTFMGYVEQFRGHGPALNRAIARWYVDKDADKLAYQVIKYRQRNGWAHRDSLRLAKPRAQRPKSRVRGGQGVPGPTNPQTAALFEWITKGRPYEDTPRLVKGFEYAQSARDAATWAGLVREYRLSWEMLPDAALGEPLVWEAMIETVIPQTALLRQLPRLTRIGLLGNNNAGVTKRVIEQITDMERLRKARVHPVSILVAQRTYAGGHSLTGSSTWTPVRQIIDALDEAFYASFGFIEPTGKRLLIALDCSASMTWPQNRVFGPPKRPLRLRNGLPIREFPGYGRDSGGALTAREAAAAMAMATARTETAYEIVGFTSGSYRFMHDDSDFGIKPLPISPRQRIDDVVSTIANVNPGGTDCALPFIWAKRNKQHFDAVTIWTDNESWAGQIHVHQALREYREWSGLPTRMIVAAMSATDYSVADPADPLSLDVVGMDGGVPQLISDFTVGRI